VTDRGNDDAAHEKRVDEHLYYACAVHFRCHRIISPLLPEKIRLGGDISVDIKSSPF